MCCLHAEASALARRSSDTLGLSRELSAPEKKIERDGDERHEDWLMARSHANVLCGVRREPRIRTSITSDVSVAATLSRCERM